MDWFWRGTHRGGAYVDFNTDIWPVVVCGVVALILILVANYFGKGQQ